MIGWTGWKVVRPSRGPEQDNQLLPSYGPMNAQRCDMRLTLILLAALLAAVQLPAYAVGVAEEGKYKVFDGEREPGEPFSNVRVVPPPTGGILKVRIKTDKPRYHVGEALRIFFSANRDSRIYIFDTDASGMTRQIFPNYYDQQNQIRAGKTYYIPDRSYDLEVTPPSGNDTLTVVAVAQDLPILREYHAYSPKDPYPASREGATALVRRLESFRTEPSALEMRAVRPVPKENLWATDSTTFFVMDRFKIPPSDYRVPRFGSLDVDTYPSNARIYIDGQYYGRSPQVIDRLEPGYRSIRLEKEGYLPYGCNIYIKTNEMKNLDIFLKQTPIEPGYERSRNPAAGTAGGLGFFFQGQDEEQPQPQQQQTPAPQPVPLQLSK